MFVFYSWTKEVRSIWAVVVGYPAYPFYTTYLRTDFCNPYARKFPLISLTYTAPGE